MTESVPFVQIESVTYTHWNQEAPTLRSLSLEIQSGTLNILVGPGGSGKSTLCSLFNGEIPHLLGGIMEGTVRIAGQDTRELEVRNLAKSIGHVLQDPEAMFSTLYVEDEIAFGPENLKMPVEEIHTLVENLLADIQILPQRHNLVWNLSGGQIQKLGIAAILAMQPQMIILDEPTANLDPLATRSVHELVLRLRQEGMTILLVMRELDDFILDQADQLLVIAEGQIWASGKPREVIDKHGKEMLEKLGIWLPETVEIGLALRSGLDRAIPHIPITVPETLQLLKLEKLLPTELQIASAPEQEQGKTSGEVLISARELKYTYSNEYQALKGVSFDIRVGEMLAIVGRNGAGKSTLAKLLVGLLKPRDGQLTLFGKPAGKWKVEDLAGQIALVFQNPEHQFLTDSVFDEIAYSYMARGLDDQEAIHRGVKETLHLLALDSVEKLHPFALSAGMKRRLGVATMLVGHPRILLVDEPTYGQDKQMTQTLMALMEDIRQQGVSVVMITHDMRLVQEFAHRAIVMNEGQILYDGDPAGLFASDDMLLSASLCPTLLQELLKAYETDGGCVRCSIRNTTDFMKALQTGLKDGKHGSK